MGKEDVMFMKQILMHPLLFRKSRIHLVMLPAAHMLGLG